LAFEKILVVDDDPPIADLVALNLRKQGYDVATAGCGEEAIQAVGHGDFSLVVLDIMMPGMDGFETPSEIRKRSDISVILLSARGDEPDKIIGFGLGADDYITKSFSPGELGGESKSPPSAIQKRRRAGSGDPSTGTRLG
jgi:DNA-binding response OmpR family regulator